MTREEASDVLDDYDVNFAGHTAEEVAEAFDVAFKALEQESCEDAISRKEAISVMCSNCPDWQTCKLNCCRRKALENKKKLTSVYPEQAECEDCISRQDAIDEFKNGTEWYDFANWCRIDIIEVLEGLPSVTPARKIGRWILTDDDLVYCSECEDSYYPRPIDASWYYCPHCGAKMEEENNG